MQLPKEANDLRSRVRYQWRDFLYFLQNPAHALGLMVATIVVFSLTFFGLLVISQNLAVQKTLDQRKEQIAKEAADTATKQKQAEENKLSSLDAQRQSDLNDLKIALAKYKKDNSTYPQILEKLTPNYIGSIPTDPESGDPYFYQPAVDYQSYILQVRLSSGQDFVINGS